MKYSAAAALWLSSFFVSVARHAERRDQHAALVVFEAAHAGHNLGQ